MNGNEGVLIVGFGIAAFLYASVGHAGASGYLVIMALVGMTPGEMRSTALILNLLVGTITLIQFVRVTGFAWRIFWPFALGAAPFAALGGALVLPSTAYRLLVAMGLLIAALRLAFPPPDGHRLVTTPPWPAALALGAGIGLLAGLTGTGGGIYLSPLLLFCGWGETRQTGAVAAAFILVNSFAGLMGHRPDPAFLPTALPAYLMAVGVGGLIGSWIGSGRVGILGFRRLLAVVLVVAAVKLQWC